MIRLLPGPDADTSARSPFQPCLLLWPLQGVTCAPAQSSEPWYSSALLGWAPAAAHLLSLEAAALLCVSLANRALFILPFDPAGRILSSAAVGYKKHPSDLERDPACKAGLQCPAPAARVLQELALLSNMVLIKMPDYGCSGEPVN